MQKHVLLYVFFLKKGEDRSVQWKRHIKNGGTKLYINFYKELLEVVESLLDVMKDEGI